MLNENAKKWVEALKSGKYKQGTGQLVTQESEWNEETMRFIPTGVKRYCCLGVLCEVAVQEGVIPSFKEDDCYLPEVVQKWVGLKTPQGIFKDNREDNSVSDVLNDREQKSFEEIAKVIESEPAELFE